MGNSKKSFLGKPVQNMYADGDFASRTYHPVNGSAGGTWVTDPRDPSKTCFRFDAYTLGNRYHGRDITVVIGTQYSYQMEIYVSPDYTGTAVAMYNEQAAAGSGIYYDLTKKGTWQRLVYNGHVAAGTTNARVLAYMLSASTAGYVLIANVQVEQSAFATPFAGTNTVNLHPYPTSVNSWGVSTYVTTTTDVGVDPFGFTTADRYINSGVGAGAQAYTRTYIPTVGMPYTCSTFFKWVSGDTKINFTSYVYGAPSGYNGVTITWTSATSVALTAIGTITNSGVQYHDNGWVRVFFTVTCTSVASAMEYNINREIAGGIAAYAASSWDLACSQIEASPNVSPFQASGFRTTEQCLVDMTNTNIPTRAGALTYASDGTYSYNGSSNWVEWPTSTAFDTQSVTMETWFKPTLTLQSGFLFEKGQVNTQYSNFLDVSGNFYFRTIGLTPQDSSIVTATYVTAGVWNQLVTTVGSGLKTIYVNGKLVAQNAVTGLMNTGQTNQYIGRYGGSAATIASSYPFNGSIAITRVYNRALSALEVTQNFAATRGRFGL
jgi:hypothetical protein